MKYASRLAALALSFAMLTACGGGGSGGGSGPVAGGDPTYYKGMITGNEGSAIGVAAYDNLANVNAEDATTMAYQGVARMARTASNPMEFTSYEDEVTITRTADGIQLVVSDDFDDDLPGRTVNWKTFKNMDDAEYQAMMSELEVEPRYIGSLSDNYLVSAEVSANSGVDSTSDAGEHYVGDITRVDMLMLGGKTVGLEFSEFGGWLSNEFFVGTTNGVAHDGWIYSEFIPTWNGDNSKAANFASLNGSHHYSGKVIGAAYTEPDNDNPTRLISGDANLDVTVGAMGAVTMNLEAIFDNFYKFSIADIPVYADGNSDYHSEYNNGAVITVTATNNDNTTSLDLAGKSIYLRKIKSQFYGSSAGSPSEAAGIFDLRDRNNDIYLVKGAFGVKR